MKKALLYLFGFVLIQFFVSWAVYAVWMLCSGDSGADVWRTFCSGNSAALTGPMLIAASAASSVVAGAVFIWRRFAVVSPTYLRTRPWGVFFWCSMAALGTLAPSAGLQELLPELPDTMSSAFKTILSNEYGYFTLCLLAPLVEELVFRGAILRALLGVFSRHWVAIAVSAAIFAIVHLNPAQMPHAFLMGLLLGWMYYRTGSILPGVVVHWVNNTVAYAIYVLMPQTADMGLVEIFGGSRNNIILSIVFSLFILLPGIYQLNRSMKPAGK